MHIHQCIRQAANNAGISLNRVSRAAGHSDNYIGVLFARNSIPQVNTAAKLLNVCGYVLCAVPRDSVPSNALVIDSDNTNSK